MKDHIPGDKVEEIKSRADIVDLISEHVTLKKAGKNFIGLCPFHKEKTPSFTVNRDKQIFYCFGCSEGGNIFSFLMKANQLSFPEAVRYLARKTGVTIPERLLTREEKEQTSVREQVIRVHLMAARHFSQNLFSQAGKEARDYLQKRAIPESIAREFCLGYAPDAWRYLRDHLEKGKVPLTLAEQSGLVVSKSCGAGFASYDRFRRRLIFPIEDINGHVIAFGGRAIGNGEPKYLNSPESPIYSKGKCLYGLNRSKESIRQKGYAILVEGYFDLLSLWTAGVTNVIATLGTALTKDHVDLIRRYTGHVVAVFDPDEAGTKALTRSLELFLAGNIHAKAVVLPGGHDPDEYIRTFGKEAFEEVVTHAQSMVDYYIEKVMGKIDTLEEQKDSLRDAVSFIRNIEDEIERNLFIKRVSERLGIDQDLLKKEVRRSLSATSRFSESKPGILHEEKIDNVEMSLIQVMLDYPGKIPEVVQTGILDRLTSAGLRAFGRELIESFARDGLECFDASFLVDRLGKGMIREVLLKRMVDEIPYDESMADCILSDAVKQIKRKWYKEKHKVLRMKLAQAEETGDKDLCHSLLVEKEQLRREEKALSS